jgi:CBS domain-containing protein
MRDLKAAHVMVKPVVSARENTLARDVALQLLSGHYTGMPVTDTEGKVVGIVTEFDLLEAIAEGRNLAQVTAAQVMTRKAITADVNTPISAILTIMKDESIIRLPITEAGKLVGIVARPDILRSQIDPALFVL